MKLKKYYNTNAFLSEAHFLLLYTSLITSLLRFTTNDEFFYAKRRHSIYNGKFK